MKPADWNALAQSVDSPTAIVKVLPHRTASICEAIADDRRQRGLRPAALAIGFFRNITCRFETSRRRHRTGMMRKGAVMRYIH